MIKKIAPNKGMINIEALGNPNAFKSKVNLGVVPKFNKHGDNIEPIIRRIPVQSIDEYAFNPRQANKSITKSSVYSGNLPQIIPSAV
jgi:hypothetical protein